MSYTPKHSERKQSEFAPRWGALPYSSTGDTVGQADLRGNLQRGGTI